jgi:hypothetical protein
MHRWEDIKMFLKVVGWERVWTVVIWIRIGKNGRLL